jgi:hypothetical protein
MEMFDELISTTIKPDGTVEERRVTGDALKAEAMDDACRAFVAAETKWAKLDAGASARWAHPDADPYDLCAYFDALEEKYQADKREDAKETRLSRNSRSTISWLGWTCQQVTFISFRI